MAGQDYTKVFPRTDLSTVEASNMKLLRVQIAIVEIQRARRRNGDNRPASWSHLEVQIFACGEECVWDEEQYAR